MEELRVSRKRGKFEVLIEGPKFIEKMFPGFEAPIIFISTEEDIPPPRFAARRNVPYLYIPQIDFFSIDIDPKMTKLFIVNLDQSVNRINVKTSEIMKVYNFRKNVKRYKLPSKKIYIWLIPSEHSVHSDGTDNSTSGEPIDEIRFIIYSSFISISFTNGLPSYPMKENKLRLRTGCFGECFLSHPWNVGKMIWAKTKLSGKFIIANLGIFEGEWNDTIQRGNATLKYLNGDIYNGWLENFNPHGFGVLNQAKRPLIYTGDWVAGFREGYGIEFDLKTKEMYRGSWREDKKDGKGVLTTSFGDYMEGMFSKGVMKGSGITISSDGNYYEGQFLKPGVFSGCGTMILKRGIRLDGIFYGSWREGYYVRAMSDPNFNTCEVVLGESCVYSSEKYRTLIRQYTDQLGIREPRPEMDGPYRKDETKSAWQQTAVFIDKHYQQFLSKTGSKNIGFTKKKPSQALVINDSLCVILEFDEKKLTYESSRKIYVYLYEAMRDIHHPLGSLVEELSVVFERSYGNAHINKYLLPQAVDEVMSIIMKFHKMITAFFPEIPDYETMIATKNHDINIAVVLQSTLLPKFYPSLINLYNMKNIDKIKRYCRRIKTLNSYEDYIVMECMGIDKQFREPPADYTNVIYAKSIEYLRMVDHFKSPPEKLLMMDLSWQEMMTATEPRFINSEYKKFRKVFFLYAFIIVRAGIEDLGSQIQFMFEFFEPHIAERNLGCLLARIEFCYEAVLRM